MARIMNARPAYRPMVGTWAWPPVNGSVVMAGAHCAYTVMLPWSGMATVPLPGPRIVSPLPGVGFMAQPVNRKPGRCTFGSFASAGMVTVVNASAVMSGYPPVPPFGSNFRATLLILHWAYRTVVLTGLLFASATSLNPLPAAYALPLPSACVFQPVNV